MAIDPWARAYQTLGDLGNTYNTQYERKRRAPLDALAMAKGQQALEEGDMRLDALKRQNQSLQDWQDLQEKLEGGKTVKEPSAQTFGGYADGPYRPGAQVTRTLPYTEADKRNERREFLMKEGKIDEALKMDEAAQARTNWMMDVITKYGPKKGAEIVSRATNTPMNSPEIQTLYNADMTPSGEIIMKDNGESLAAIRVPGVGYELRKFSRKTENGGAGGSGTPYFRPIITDDGVYSFDARKGTAALTQTPSGETITDYRADPDLQAKLSKAKKVGDKVAEYFVEQGVVELPKLQNSYINLTELEDYVRDNPDAVNGFQKMVDAVQRFGPDILKSEDAFDRQRMEAKVGGLLTEDLRRMFGPPFSDVDIQIMMRMTGADLTSPITALEAIKSAKREVTAKLKKSRKAEKRVEEIAGEDLSNYQGTGLKDDPYNLSGMSDSEITNAVNKELKKGDYFIGKDGSLRGPLP